MSKQDLEAIATPVYLILGDRDLLFPYKKSLAIARTHIRSLKKSFVIPDTGHGIETSKDAIAIISAIATDNESVNISNE